MYLYYSLKDCKLRQAYYINTECSSLTVMEILINFQPSHFIGSIQGFLFQVSITVITADTVLDRVMVKSEKIDNMIPQ